MHTARVDFRYPSCWSAATFPQSSLGLISLAYLSNETMHNPCTTHRSGTETTTHCAWAVSTLKPDGVLVSWSLLGMPGLTLRSQRGTNILIGGHHAKFSVTTGSVCGSLHAAERISVLIATATPDNLLMMVACLGARHVLDERDLVTTMLASVTLH